MRNMEKVLQIYVTTNMKIYIYLIVNLVFLILFISLYIKN